MSPRRARRRAASLLLALAVAVPAVGCGRQPAPDPVVAGSAGTSPSTTVVAPAGAGGAPSTVAGLTAAEVREAVEAPEPQGRARTAGPVAQPVRLAGGATVWRVRIPGRFPVRSARVVVSVGGRDLGEGVPGSKLQGLVAITRDPRGIVAGAPVAYRAPGAPAVAAGRLVVVR